MIDIEIKISRDHLAGVDVKGRVYPMDEMFFFFYLHCLLHSFNVLVFKTL